MKRIIYLDIQLGYKCANIKTQQALLNKESKIASQGHHMICVLDLDSETVIKKGESFSAHVGFFQSCYPSVALNGLPFSPVPELSRRMILDSINNSR